MKIILSVLQAVFLSLIIISNCYSQASRNALSRYINSKDNSFQWKVDSTTETPHGSYHEIDLTSQTWHSIVWKHHMIVCLPRHADHPNTVLLLLRHIENRAADRAALKIISDSTGTPAAVLYDIPNQPLFDGKEEDDLQAYTFSQFIKTGDETWPLLLPMTKSVIRAMDVIQELAIRQNNPAINKFVITGHSKRGHTAWLSAVVDNRIKGIIPIAIDVLNSPVQLPHHLASFGEYSTPSKAATDFLKEINTPRGKRLIEIIDPYSYNEQLTLPKLIVSA
ncbi:MAG TPA: PhoPQ-activated protein PqaA family protein, partial [Flavitalea sp.]|nr:PhoPQ-activated protein PqaA family protein [Flavitalea sp.]